MNTNYTLTLCFDDGQAHLKLNSHRNLNRNWFGNFALKIFYKALSYTSLNKSFTNIQLNKEQLQQLYIDITSLYQCSLIKYNIEKDIRKIKVPKQLFNITQSILLMLRMNDIHQSIKSIQNFYFEEFRTLNTSQLDESINVLLVNNLIQKITTNNKQVFYDKNPKPHSHIYFKKQNQLIDCNEDCYKVLVQTNFIDCKKPKLFEIYY